MSYLHKQIILIECSEKPATLRHPYSRATGFANRVKKKVCGNYFHDSTLVVHVIILYNANLLVHTTSRCMMNLQKFSHAMRNSKIAYGKSYVARPIYRLATFQCFRTSL